MLRIPARSLLLSGRQLGTHAAMTNRRYGLLFCMVALAPLVTAGTAACAETHKSKSATTKHAHAPAHAGKTTPTKSHAHTDSAHHESPHHKKTASSAHAHAGDPSTRHPHHAHAHVTPPVKAGAAAAVGAGTAAAVAPDATDQLPPDAVTAGPQDKGSNTGLPLPRFAAMRADKVYMRKGPGQRYPIEWVYHRRGLPVKVEREFDVWRLVEDADGTKGWVHQATLVGQRTFVIPGEPPIGHTAAVGEASAKAGDMIGRADARVTGHVASEQEARDLKGDSILFAHADEGSAVVAVLEPGTVGNIKECPQGSGWCHVVVKGYNGWLPRRLFWGLLPGEVIQPS